MKKLSIASGNCGNQAAWCGDSMKRLLLAAALLLISPMAHATLHYVDCQVSSSGTGLSWATAWQGLGNITGVAAGDTVYISGSTACASYSTTQWVIAGGTSGSPITYSVGQDAGHTSPVTITLSGAPGITGTSGTLGWATITGNFGGTQDMSISGSIGASGSTPWNGLRLSYLNLTGPVECTTCQNYQIDHNVVTVPNGADHFFTSGASAGVIGYTLNSIHDNILNLQAVNDSSGHGSDGFQWIENVTFYNNTTYWTFNSSANGQHADGIQTSGSYVDIHDNYCENAGNYCVYGDLFGSILHWRAYNNVFAEFSGHGTGISAQQIGIGFECTSCGTITDMVISNNTFYRQDSGQSCITINPGNTSNSGVYTIVNNTCYNTSINSVPGTGGTATLSNNFSGTTGAAFVNIAPYPTGNWAETSGSTATIGQGINAAPTYLTSVYTTDKAGNTRINPWDIGAYQFTAGHTYYIRPDGGGRYTAARQAGTNLASGAQTGINIGCNGLADVSYSAAVAAAGGSTTNLPCAFFDWRFLWDDQSAHNSETQGWILVPGDTVILRGGPWRTGYDAAPGSCSGAGCGAGWTWNYQAFDGSTLSPPVPSGTSANHIRILGENFASCNNGPEWTNTLKGSLTQIFGGWTIGDPVNLSGAQYVDLECIEITRHSNCVVFGSPAVPAACSNGSITPALGDYDSDGIHTSNTTSNVTMTDMWIHGHPGRAIKGPIGGSVTCTRCNLDTNGETGWDFDDGNNAIGPGGSTVMPAGAQWNFLHSIIQWSGCNPEYPAVDPIPVQTCYSQSTGGLGDAVGTPHGTGMSATIDHSTFAYSTQDGLDFGHIDTNATGTPYVVTITNSRAYAQNGGAWKFGSLISNLVFTDNTAVCNGLRLSQPITGVPSGFNTNLADYVRSEDCMPIQFNQTETMLIANNSFVSYMPVFFDEQCVVAGVGGSCPGTVIKIYNNVFFGIDNPATYTLGGQAGGGAWYFTSLGTGPVIDNQNNIYFQGRFCSNGGTLGTGEKCTNTLLVNQPTGNVGTFVESELDNFNFNLTSASPAKGAGKTYTGMPTNDYAGNPFASPRSMGAFEFQVGTHTLFQLGNFIRKGKF